jgi:hypothetical protein
MTLWDIPPVNFFRDHLVGRKSDEKCRKSTKPDQNRLNFPASGSFSRLLDVLPARSRQLDDAFELVCFRSARSPVFFAGIDPSI